MSRVASMLCDCRVGSMAVFFTLICSCIAAVQSHCHATAALEMAFKLG